MIRSTPWPPLLTALAAAACGHDARGELHVMSGQTMGSTWGLKWHGGAAPDAVRDAVLAELALTGATFSTWGDDSELARFNAWRSDAPFPASELLRTAVALGLAVAEASDGAFDPTCKPLTDLYRAARNSGRNGNGHTFEPAALAAARARIGHRSLRVVGASLVKAKPDLEVDLDGLVAGLCADRIGARLTELGVAGFLLDVTGEVLCRGTRPDGVVWQVGIDDPGSPPDARTPLVTLPLRDAALCTSGDYRNFVVQDGAVWSHVLDPRTARNPAHGAVSVSVLARSCALADALDTALLVTGPGAAAEVLARCAEPGAGALFVVTGESGELRQQAIGWPAGFGADGRPLPR